jgi:REP element-mobilizing transposase RayT
VTFYRRNLPHLQRDYKPHFITFVTKNRRALVDWARQIVFDCCLHDHRKRYNLRVVVVMPDHAHMILTPLVDEVGRRMFPLPEIMKALKGTSSHAINRRLGAHDVLWQEESFDHVLRSSESLDAKIDYILQNPVRAGLVSVASEYRWSWRKPIESPYSPVVVPLSRP